MIDHSTALFFLGLYAFVEMIDDLGRLITNGPTAKRWFVLGWDSAIMAWALVSLGMVIR